MFKLINSYICIRKSIRNIYWIVNCEFRIVVTYLLRTRLNFLYTSLYKVC